MVKKILAVAMLVAAPLSAQDKKQSVRGEVTVVNEFTWQVTVKTTQVPGMEGKNSSVAFVVKDTTQLKNYKVGDKVVGDLVTKGSDTYLENVKVEKK